MATQKKRRYIKNKRIGGRSKTKNKHKHIKSNKKKIHHYICKHKRKYKTIRSRRKFKTKDVMDKARQNKLDEFYTQSSDIEEELRHYKYHFNGATVFCNCDDPETSNFWNYFVLNFEHLKIRKLISTHFESGNKSSYMLSYDGDSLKRLPLQGNGDFRSAECINILKEATIVVTNPPFSLFREYVAQLIEHNKKFLIIGNNNALSYNEIFKLIKTNKLWLGYASNKTMEFKLAPSYTKWTRLDDKTGDKYGAVPCISWFTNLPHQKRIEKLTLSCEYKGNESSYPKYDNYDAIEVSRVSLIPIDYEGQMGVPITFLGVFNPDQFILIGKMSSTTVDEFNLGYPFVAGVKKYARVIIKHRKDI